MMGSALFMLGTLVVTSPTVSGPIEALESVYTVTTPSGSQGAAFAVDDVTLVTAAHVVEGDEFVRLEGTQSPPLRLRASVRFRDDVTDVAVLKLAEPLPAGAATLAWSPRQVSDGLEVFAVGSPIDGVVLSRGEVLGIDQDGWIMASAPVDPGNSGGPLLDEDGAVLGVVVAQKEIGGEALAVPADTAREVVIEAFKTTPSVVADDEPPAAAPASNGLTLVALAIAALAIATSVAALVVALTRAPRNRKPPINITLD